MVSACASPCLLSVEKLERGLAYGEACFETFRVINGRVFALPYHGQRLSRAAAAFGWSVDGHTYCRQAVEQARLHAADDVLLRLTLTAGTQPWGLLPANAPVTHAYVQILPTPARSPLRLMSLDASAFPLRPKIAKYSADYADFLRLFQLYRTRLGSEYMPLWTLDGRVISTMTANILLCMDGQWLTPDDARCLPGTVRQHLLNAGVLRVAPCSSAMLQQCQAIACCNSSLFVQAVSWLDGRAFDNETNHAFISPLLDALRGHDGVPC